MVIIGTSTVACFPTGQNIIFFFTLKKERKKNGTVEFGGQIDGSPSFRNFKYILLLSVMVARESLNEYRCKERKQ